MSILDIPRDKLLALTDAIITKHPDFVDMVVERQRKRLSDLVLEHFHGIVNYGPFRGMRVFPNAFWGGADFGTMALGLYEQEVLKELLDATRERSVFVDVGAADGYYAIGILVSGMCAKSYCFEMSEQGREIIASNADANNLRDRVEIRGEATATFFDEIEESERNRAVLLVDIEGGEFDVLTPMAFRAFAQSTIIVELHDWVEDADAKIERLKAEASATHSVRAFSTGARDLSAIGELKSLCDTNRWLLCSEGRPRLMSWLRFDPL